MTTANYSTRRLARSATVLATLLCTNQVFAIEVHVRDQNGAPVTDAVVYAAPIDGRLPHTRPASASIMQKNKMFMPVVTVVQKQASVNFPNRDDIAHDVYSISDPKRFELKLYRGAARPIVFDKPGLVTIGCNIHDTMIAYVLVVDTPYFAKTDPHGNATLPDMPRGRYRVRVWQYQQLDPEERGERTIWIPMATPLRFSVSLSAH